MSNYTCDYCGGPVTDLGRLGWTEDARGRPSIGGGTCEQKCEDALKVREALKPEKTSGPIAVEDLF